MKTYQIMFLKQLFWMKTYPVKLKNCSVGLKPTFSCYENSSDGWNTFIHFVNSYLIRMKTYIHDVGTWKWIKRFCWMATFTFVLTRIFIYEMKLFLRNLLKINEFKCIKLSDGSWMREHLLLILKIFSRIKTHSFCENTSFVCLFIHS